jgi:hypothetical protein
MMANRYPESSLLHHTTLVRGMLGDLISHLRQDVDKVCDPSARALFKTSAEVLSGLAKAYEDFEKKNENAWQ